ncbi:hypothetical protein VX037_08205 [Gordonia sp. Z-3]|jgi:hypothetical protein|uniref:Uncharacterized protein n=2 Tax=Gordonia TaxID=2053 RepID=A0A9X3D3J7_9ACTN|nr:MULTISPECIES: hypothetical protein [Gordonia]MAU84606.1 hypothetical protein [Gordonia sp. (in: high G+C Gram-positive bacteria)]MCF3938030.1 hypothetical protein [Gordonia tangerina]MCX2963814.1 hypothetical protein [Gordonia aquimaris]MED5801003.1 hypothetical protein [Gordonia sp. Z-3]
MSRTRFVEDLTPGDRISVNGIRAVVRTPATRTATDQLLLELVTSSDDDRSEILLDSGAKVEIL